MAEKLNETPDSRARSNVQNDVIASYVREVTSTARAIAEANGKHRAVLKRAESEGINTKALLAAIKAKNQDEDVVVANLRDTVRYMNVTGIKVSSSGLFDDLDIEPLDGKAADDQADWAAEEAGFACGVDNGARDDNVYPPGTSAHARWDEGFKRGKKKLAEDATDKDKPASTRTAKNRPAQVH